MKTSHIVIAAAAAAAAFYYWRRRSSASASSAPALGAREGNHAAGLGTLTAPPPSGTLGAYGYLPNPLAVPTKSGLTTGGKTGDCGCGCSGGCDDAGGGFSVTYEAPIRYAEPSTTVAPTSPTPTYSRTFGGGTAVYGGLA